MRVNPEQRVWFHRVRRLMYWVLPVVLLWIIFTRVDWPRIRDLLTQVHPGWLAGALLTYPLSCLLGAWRWQALLSMYLGRRIPFGFILRHYFIGLVIGFFAPASAGWDVYRVIAAGRVHGHYRLNIAAVLVEKFLALLSAGLLVVVLLPVVKRWATPAAAPWLNALQAAAIAGLLLCGAVLAVLLFLARNRAVDLASRKIQSVAAHLLAKTGLPAAREEAAPLALSDLFRPLMHPGSFASLLLISMLIQITNACGGSMKFRALGLPVPFPVNLFVVPILLFIFILPISFGSVGVREGSNIMLYGLFGVPAETALLASFLGLGGLLLNQAIGAVVLWRTGTSQKT